MSSSQTYSTQPRTGLGSNAAIKLRAAGQIPMTISRSGHPSQHLAIDEKQANHLAAHVIHLCTIEVGGKKLTTLRSTINKDCMSDRITHIDLLEVDAHSEIKVDVAVVPDARNCPGVKAGGIVELRARTIKVKCKADSIPDQITVELSKVELQGSLHVGDLVLPKGVTLVTPAKALLLSVVIPRGLKAATEEAATAAAAAAEGAVPAAAGATPATAPAADAKAGAKPAAGKAPAADAKDAGKKK